MDNMDSSWLHNIDISRYLFIILLLTGLAMMMFALIAFLRKKGKGGASFTGFCISSGIYSIFYGLEIISPSVDSALLWNNIQYLGIATLPAWILLFSIHYLELSFLMKRRWDLLVWIIPVIVIASKFTDQYHNLVYQDVNGTIHQGLLILKIVPGNVYILNIVYSNLAFILAFFMFANALRLSRMTHKRKQIHLLIMLGFIAPWIASLLYLFNVSPHGMDISPFGFALTSLILGYAFFRNEFFKISPTVYNHVFNGMRDGIIVINNENNIIEINQAALSLFKIYTSPVLGNSFETQLSEYPDLVEFFHSDLKDTVFNATVDNKERIYLIKKSQIRYAGLMPYGSVIFFNDITEVRNTEQELKFKTEELQDYFTNSLDLLCIMTHDGVFIHVNPVWQRIMGYAPEILIGTRVLDYVHPEDRAQIMQKMKDPSLINSVFTCLIRFISGNNNNYHWLEWSIRKTDSKLFATLRDITPRMKEQLSLKKLIGFSEEFLRFSTGEIDYQVICNNFHDLSNARMVLLNELADSRTFVTKGFSGSLEDMASIEKALDQNMIGATWTIDKQHTDHSISGNIVKYKSFREFANGLLMPEPLKKIDHILSSGELYFLKILSGNFIKGNFLFFYDKEGSSVNEEILKLYSHKVGLLLARKAEEENSLAERTYFENLFEGSPAGIVILDNEDRIMRCNKEFLEMFGYCDSEVIGNHINDLIVPDHLKKESLSLTYAVSEGNSINHDTLRKRKDGSLINVSILGKPVVINNTQHFVYGIYFDTTEQVRVKEELKTQQIQLQRAFDFQHLISDVSLALNLPKEFDVHINEVLMIIGKRMDVSSISIWENNSDNINLTNTFEWRSKDIEPPIVNMHFVDYESLPGLKETLQEQGSLVARNINDTTPSIRVFLIEHNIKAIIINALLINENIYGFICFNEYRSDRDWSVSEIELLRGVCAIISNAYERRLIELSLLEERDKANLANLAKSEFLANMSHEIRTPMNAILGFSETLYEELNDPEHKTMLNSVLSSGRSLLSLLNDILDLSKIESGRMDFTNHPFDLISLINEVILLFRDKTTRKGINILFEKPGGYFPENVSLDEIRVKQVLFNLIGNAVKFTHEGAITISLHYDITGRNSASIKCVIRDTGIGIPEDQLEAIFDSFKQVSERLGKKYEGTGLGLSISKRLMEKMNGQILVESKVGEGSVFTILFNDILLENIDLTPDVIIESYESVVFEKATVLIIDDVEVNIMLVEGMLETLGLKTISALNGNDGLGLLSETIPDLILLDIRMPETDGFEVVRILKGNPKTAEIPVIAYTAALIELTSNIDSKLFNGYLFKPISKKALVDELMKFLRYSTIEAYENILDINGSLENGVLNEKKPEQYPSLLKMLKEVFIPHWETIKDQYVLYKIESFAIQLKEAAILHNFAFLKNYAERLLEHVDSLDLDELRLTLLAFPDIVKKMDDVKE